MENKSAHHCCFGDGPEAVDENVAGYVDRRTWREGAETREVRVHNIYADRRRGDVFVITERGKPARES